MDIITVLLLTYNQEEYIYQAIDSVLIQECENIQLIIADDGSDYFIPEEVDNYIKKNSRGNLFEYIILKNNVNIGTVRNINRACCYIKGQYVVVLSGDDMFYDKYVLSNYIKCFKENVEKDVLISQVLHFDHSMKTALSKCLSEEHIDLLNEGNYRKLYGRICMECFIPAVGTAYRKEVLEKLGPFDEKYYLIEDWPYYLKMIKQGVKLGYVDFISSKHREGGVSHMKKKRRDERNDRYHQDLINIIKNEIYPNYTYADPSMQKKVFNYANDRIVISEFRSEFFKMSFLEKTKWLCKNYNIPLIVARGCIRRIKKTDI